MNKPAIAKKPLQAPTPEQERIMSGAPNYVPPAAAPTEAPKPASRKQPEPTTRLPVDITVRHHKKLKQYCLDNDTTFKEVIGDFLDYMFENKPLEHPLPPVTEE